MKEEPTEKSESPSVPLRLNVLDTDLSKICSLSQPPDGELLDSLPIVQLAEDAGLLISLFSLLYPIAPVILDSYEKSVRLTRCLPEIRHGISSIRYSCRDQTWSAPCTSWDCFSRSPEVSNGLRTVTYRAISRQDPSFILPETALYVYFLSQEYELHPEVLRAARSTLRLSMTIEALEDKVNFMPGAYLRELWKYHKKIRKDLVSSPLEFRKSGPPQLSSGD